MTKPLTSVAVMQLYEQGLFQLDDPVARVLPEFAEMRVAVGGNRAKLETEPARRADHRPRSPHPHGAA